MAGAPPSPAPPAASPVPPAPPSPPPGVIYWIITEWESEEGNKDIYFQVVTPGSPAELQALKNEVERTLSAIRTVYGAPQHEGRFNEAFTKLLRLTQLGLAGPRPAPHEASAALAALQAEIVAREAGRIKNAYMVRLGVWAASLGGASAMLYFVLDQNRRWPPPEIYAYRHAFIVWTGCMAGAWASFASRKVKLGFYDLGNLEEDSISPGLRLLFAGVLTSFLLLIFATGFANVVVGGFDASRALASGSTALLVGAFSGLSEQALPAAVMQRAQAFLSGSART